MELRGGGVLRQSHPQRPSTLLPEFPEVGSQEVTSTPEQRSALGATLTHRGAAQVTWAALEAQLLASTHLYNFQGRSRHEVLGQGH